MATHSSPVPLALGTSWDAERGAPLPLGSTVVVAGAGGRGSVGVVYVGRGGAFAFLVLDFDYELW